MTTHACGGIKDDTLVTGVEAQQEELLTSKTSMDVETEEQNHRVSCAPQTVSARPSNGIELHDARREYFEERLEYNQPSALDSEDDQWQVEALIKKRRRGRRVEYLVKWRGYPDSDNTWEKKTDINPDLVADFEVNAYKRG
jgi:hypothetical protein